MSIIQIGPQNYTRKKCSTDISTYHYRTVYRIRVTGTGKKNFSLYKYAYLQRVPTPATACLGSEVKLYRLQECRIYSSRYISSEPLGKGLTASSPELNREKIDRNRENGRILIGIHTK